MTLKHIYTKNRGIWEEFAIRGLWLARKTEMAARSYSVEECNMDKNRTKQRTQPDRLVRKNKATVIKQPSSVRPTQV